jgi:hypothetical protein
MSSGVCEFFVLESCQPNSRPGNDSVSDEVSRHKGGVLVAAALATRSSDCHWCAQGQKISRRKQAQYVSSSALTHAPQLAVCDLLHADDVEVVLLEEVEEHTRLTVSAATTHHNTYFHQKQLSNSRSSG